MRPIFYMKPKSYHRAFTLLEIVVILGIIALFLALLVPFVVRTRQGGRSAACVRNLQEIGKAMGAYVTEHEGRLPGPLTRDQYPVDSAGTPPRDGQLLKYLGTYLEQQPGGARAVFTFPAWQTAQRATDAAVFLANVDTVLPYDQSPWGDMEAKGKGPLKVDDLRTVQFTIGETKQTTNLAKFYALTEADQVLARIVADKVEPWLERLPANAVHVSHRNALYFDWHVDKLVLTNSSMTPPTAD